MKYLVLLENIKSNGVVFYSGVCFPDFIKNENDYSVIYEAKIYYFPLNSVIETDIKTRLINEPASQYIANKFEDKTTDYLKAVKERIGIDMTQNYSPQFRDGKDPMQDKK